MFSFFFFWGGIEPKQNKKRIRDLSASISLVLMYVCVKLRKICVFI